MSHILTYDELVNSIVNKVNQVACDYTADQYLHDFDVDYTRNQDYFFINIHDEFNSYETYFTSINASTYIMQMDETLLGYYDYFCVGWDDIKDRIDIYLESADETEDKDEIAIVKQYQLLLEKNDEAGLEELNPEFEHIIYSHFKTAYNDELEYLLNQANEEPDVCDVVEDLYNVYLHNKKGIA